MAKVTPANQIGHQFPLLANAFRFVSKHTRSKPIVDQMCVLADRAIDLLGADAGFKQRFTNAFENWLWRRCTYVGVMGARHIFGDDAEFQANVDALLIVFNIDASSRQHLIALLDEHEAIRQRYDRIAYYAILRHTVCLEHFNKLLKNPDDSTALERVLNTTNSTKLLSDFLQITLEGGSVITAASRAKSLTPANQIGSEFTLLANIFNFASNHNVNVDQLSVLADKALELLAKDAVGFKRHVTYNFYSYLLQLVRLDLTSVLDDYEDSLPEVVKTLCTNVISPTNIDEVIDALGYCTNGDATDALQHLYMYLQSKKWINAAFILNYAQVGQTILPNFLQIVIEGHDVVAALRKAGFSKHADNIQTLLDKMHDLQHDQTMQGDVPKEVSDPNAAHPTYKLTDGQGAWRSREIKYETRYQRNNLQLVRPLREKMQG